MDQEIVMLSELSQTENDKYTISVIRAIKKNDTNGLIYKTEIHPQT